MQQYFNAVVSHLFSAPIPLSLRSGRSCWLRGQSSRVSPALDVLLAVLSCSLALLLLFSHTLPLTFSATLWCNVSASSFTFSLSLSLDPSDTPVVTQPGRKQQKRENTHTHTRVILFRFPPSPTHTLPWEIQSLLRAPSRGLLFLSLTLDAEAMHDSEHSPVSVDLFSGLRWGFRTLEFILEPHNQTQNLRTSSESTYQTTRWHQNQHWSLRINLRTSSNVEFCKKTSCWTP